MGNFESTREDVNPSPGQSIKNMPRTNSVSTGSCNCLLLGTGFSGKSTLFFQLVKLDQTQKKTYKEISTGMIPTIYYNTFNLTFFTADEVSKNGKFSSPETAKYIEKLKKSVSSELDPRGFYDQLILQHTKGPVISIFKMLIDVWKDEGMNRALPSLKDCQYYFDGAEHFCVVETLERLSMTEYQPSDEDVLRSRRKTTGVFTTQLTIDGLTYLFTDVGGQRSERKKWIQVCKNADILLYVISLSDYDEALWEDPSINRMKEALDTFDQTVNQDIFSDTPIVVAFNKVDLLKKKIVNHSAEMKEAFPEYKDGADYEKALSFLMAQFLNRYKGSPDNIASLPVQLLNGEHVRKGFSLIQKFGTRLQKENKLKKEVKK